LHVEQSCPPGVAAELRGAGELIPQRTTVQSGEKGHKDEHGQGQNGSQANQTVQIHQWHMQTTLGAENIRIEYGILDKNDGNSPIHLTQGGQNQKQSTEQEEGVHRRSAALEDHGKGRLSPGHDIVGIYGGRQ